MNADKLTRDYRCSRCWSALVLKHIDDQWQVVCAHDPTHRNYVTAHFVNTRRTLDMLEAAEVGSRYAVLLNLVRPNLNAASQALYGDDEGIG